MPAMPQPPMAACVHAAVLGPVLGRVMLLGTLWCSRGFTQCAVHGEMPLGLHGAAPLCTSVWCPCGLSVPCSRLRVSCFRVLVQQGPPCRLLCPYITCGYSMQLLFAFVWWESAQMRCKVLGTCLLRCLHCHTYGYYRPGALKGCAPGTASVSCCNCTKCQGV